MQGEIGAIDLNYPQIFHHSLEAYLSVIDRTIQQNEPRSEDPIQH